jgi:integrase
MPRISEPRPGEPISLVQNASGHVYRAIVDTSTPGQPRRQVRRTFPTLSAAREWVRSTREAVAKGSYLADSKITLAQLADDWLASKRDVRPITLNGYRGALRPAVDLLGSRGVQTLSRRDIEQLVSWASEAGGKSGRPLSQRSVSYMIITLRQVLDFALDAGLVPANVAARVQAPRRTAADHKPRTVWTPGELITFREVADRDPWAGVWRLVLSGLRRSEVLGLAWDHVDLDAGTVTITAGRVLLARGETSTDEPKSSASRRTVPVEAMHPGSVALLRALRASQAADRLAAGTAWHGSDLVVIDGIGRPAHPDAVTDGWRRLCREAGVTETGTHAIRHALATSLHGVGVAPADASTLLGHEVGTHLAHYVVSSQAGAVRAADSLGRLLAEG